MAQGAQCGLARQRARRFTGCHRSRVHSCHQAGGDSFHVTFHAGNLPGEKNALGGAQLESGGYERRRIDISVAVDLSEAQELGRFETRNHPQHARLVAKFHVVLEADQVEAPRAQILLPQLHHGVRPSAGARIAQSHRLHGPEAQRLPPPPRQFLDRQAGFEERRAVLCNVRGDGLGLQQRVDETLVLIAVQRAIQIVAGRIHRLAVARSPESYARVHRIGVDNRADGIVKVEAFGAGQARDVICQRVAGQRTGCDDDDWLRRNRGYLLAAYLDQRLGGDGRRHLVGEYIPVHGKRLPAWNARAGRHFEQQRTEPPQFFLEQPRRGGLGLRLERVAAHQLRQPVRLVRGRGPHRPHLVQHARQAPARDLPSRLGTRQARADNVNGIAHAELTGYKSPCLARGSRSATRGPAPRNRVRMVACCQRRRKRSTRGPMCCASSVFPSASCEAGSARN